MDDKATLKQLKKTADMFVQARNWQRYHTPKNLVMALAVEAAELAEIFQWMTEQESRSAIEPGPVRDHVKEEMADVLAYLLNLANALDIDLSDAFDEKMAKNGRKYPEGKDIVF